MPHIILECPRQLAERHDLGDLLDRLHAAIVREPSVSAADVKSRVHLLDQWRCGAPGSDAAFVHARVVLTRPRTAAQQASIQELILDGLVGAFGRPPGSLQVCVELTTVAEGRYIKAVSS